MAVQVPIGEKALSIRISQRAETVMFSLRTRDPAEAKRRHSQAQAYLQGVWQALRDGPKPLTNKQVHALAGDTYRFMAGQLEDEPGSAEMWSNLIRISKAALEKIPRRTSLLIEPSQERRGPSITLEGWFGPHVDNVLAARSLIIDAESRQRLLMATAKATIDAAEKLRRNAGGDYTPDPAAARYPQWTEPGKSQAPATVKGSLTFDAMLAAWWHEGQASGLSESTRESYFATFRRLAELLKHSDPRRVTPEDVVQFKNHRLAQINPRTGRPVSAKTVNDSDLVALKAVYGWALKNLLVVSNPAAGITVTVGKPPRTRSKGFTDAEAKAILKAALHYEAAPRELPQTAAMKRWVPWLCAYTGARVGEMVQLRKNDVWQEGEIWIVSINPEAGDVKDKERRDVPLHPHLVEQGFPEFVARATSTYLFTNPKQGEKPARRGGPRNRLQSWVRGIVTDPRVAPNHGWRHRFITQCRAHGVDQEIRRMITGHSGEGTDEQDYGDAAGLYREICKLPAYMVD